MRAMIVVTHLLGTGHLARAAAIAEGLAAAGWSVVLVSGGRPAPHLTDRSEAAGVAVVQLPSVASDGVDFARLLDDAGAPIDGALTAARRHALTETLARRRPDVVMTELFPFGRRALAVVFEVLLAAAQALSPRPLIFASVRDVLAPPSTEKKAAQTAERLARFYDGVLAHSDPAVTRLEASWPLTPAMAAITRYTGYVTSAATTVHDADGERPEEGAVSTSDEGRDEILVSAGGGPVGQPLFEAAVAAAAQGGGGGRRWRLLVGGGDRAARIEALRATVGDVRSSRLIIEPVRPDFRALLGRAAVSVSQAGYNTMLDVVLARRRAVIAPFAEGGETEQTQRAASFAARYGWRVSPENALSGAALAAAVDAALAGPAPSAAPPDVDGVAGTARILERAVHEARP